MWFYSLIFLYGQEYSRLKNKNIQNSLIPVSVIYITSKPMMSVEMIPDYSKYELSHQRCNRAGVYRQFKHY